MATKYWTGGADDNNFATAGNWSDSAAPTGGDICVLSADPASGVDNIAGADHTGLGSLTLIVGPNWSGNIGDASTAVQLKLASLEYAGQGSIVHLNAEASVTTTECIITDTGTGTMPFRLTGTNTITSLKVTDARGTVEIDGTRTVTTVDVIGARRTAIVDMTFNNSVSGTTARVNGGTLKIKGNYTNVEVSGTGTLEVTGTPTITTLDMYGGVVEWKTSGTTSAISTRLGVYSGTFDAENCTATESTITGTEVYASGTIDERNGIEGVIWSGGIVVNGGTLLLDPGRQITVS